MLTPRKSDKKLTGGSSVHGSCCWLLLLAWPAVGGSGVVREGACSLGKASLSSVRGSRRLVSVGPFLANYCTLPLLPLNLDQVARCHCRCLQKGKVLLSFHHHSSLWFTAWSNVKHHSDTCSPTIATIIEQFTGGKS